MFESYFLSVGHAAGVFCFQKVFISGFWGHAQFEEIALLLIFGVFFQYIDAHLQPNAKAA